MKSYDSPPQYHHAELRGRQRHRVPEKGLGRIAQKPSCQDGLVTKLTRNNVKDPLHENRLAYFNA
jgi:hypothetical protein